MDGRAKLLGLLGGPLAAGAAVGLRRWFLGWGAAREEVRAELPGDEIVERPRAASTRAIDVAADAEDVWPWLAQLGQGRGGFYSYERLENLFGCRMRNADRVIDELQDIRVGDEVRLMPPDAKVDLAFEVALAEPNRALVLRAPRGREDAFAAGLPFPSWAFVIEPVSPGHVRLLVRWRSDFIPSPVGYLTAKFGIEPVQFVMERKMLKGIKARAERLAAERAGLERRSPLAA
jgi:hypothetical protein